MEEDQVVLVSNDGVNFKLPYYIAKKCGVIKKLVKDAGMAYPVPLPEVDGQTLSKIVEFMKYHSQEGKAVQLAELTEKEKEKDKEKIKPIFQDWDYEFFKMDVSALISLTCAANYLEHKVLLEMAICSMAESIKGKTPAEIRKHFNMPEPEES